MGHFLGGAQPSCGNCFLNTGEEVFDRALAALFEGSGQLFDSFCFRVSRTDRVHGDPKRSKLVGEGFGKAKNSRLDVLERMRLSMGCLAEIEVMLIILPHFCSFMQGMTS